MIHLLIIADDFTGALDTGVAFAACGIRTRVVVDPDADLSACDTRVLVVDTETRHVPAAQAYKTVYELTRRAKETGVSYIYKKTDSALRGNIGAELAAILEAGGCRRLPFLPAFPQTGRVTRGGVHYVDGVPVTESPFGKDPFEPVRHAVVSELIAEQCSLPTKSYPALSELASVPRENGILIFDADCAEDLARTGRLLFEAGDLGIMAGCAGFAAVLPSLLGMDTGTPLSQPRLDPRLLVVCGSVNPITLAQLDRAEEAGFARLRLTPHQKLDAGYWEGEEGQAELVQIEGMLASKPYCIIETNDPGGNQPTADYAASLGLDREALRVRISGNLGSLVRFIFHSPSLGTLMLTGGDTLLQCMNRLGVKELEPICELEKGVVLASFTHEGCERTVITKSGGFGKEDLLIGLAEHIAHD